VAEKTLISWTEQAADESALFHALIAAEVALVTGDSTNISEEEAKRLLVAYAHAYAALKTAEGEAACERAIQCAMEWEVLPRH